MQRTVLSCGQGTNTTYQSATSTGPFCCPMGGVNMVSLSLSGGGGSGATGTGGYGQSAYAAVYSRLTMVLGKNPNGGTVTSQINVAGSTPTGGNQSALNAGGAVNSNPVYYYDATDIDAITAGQGVGFMQTLSATTVFAAMPSLSVACDTLGQGFCSPFMFAANGAQVWNSAFKFSQLSGLSAGANTAGLAACQNYNARAFVASYLQWQSLTGNTDTDAQATCAFSYNSTWGSFTDSTMSATIHGASYVGIQYDATDICAVPASNYFGMNWSGNVSTSTLKIANSGAHMLAAGNNSCWMAAGATGGATWATQSPTYCPFGGSRFDPIAVESVSTVPTSGVFSGLAVQIGTYTDPSTFTVLNGPGTGDTGAGSGNIPTSGGNSATAGFNNTSMAASPTAAGWTYDATDIAAFTASQAFLLQAVGTVGGATLVAQACNFTAPAHLGLTTMGAG